MKTRKFSLAQILTFVLAFVLTFAMAVPAFASESPDDGMTIKILPSTGANTAYGNRFNAYAIFVGTLDPKDAATGITPQDPVNPNNSVALYNLEWGPKFKERAKAFIDFLKDKANNTDGGFNLRDLFKDINPTNEKDAQSPEVATNVAKILEKNKNLPEFVITFAKVANAFIENNHIEGLVSTWNEEHKRWDIPVESAGYYLILDKYRSLKEDDEEYGSTYKDEVTGFILAVLGDQFVNMKSKTPTVEKDIVDSSAGTSKGDTADIGDLVTFKLTGTLSENYDQFTSFKYIFHDTLSKGLTYKGELKVVAINATDNSETVIEYLDGKNYNVVTSIDPVTGVTELTVEFPNLKTLKKVVDEVESDIKITEYSQIVVTYKAEVNKDAVIGSKGNPNDVYLEFSNDPLVNSTGKTTKKEVYVYSFGLEITKYADDEVDENGKPIKKLPGAEFVLIKDGEYATFEGATGTKDNPQKLSGWVTDLEDATKLVSDSEGKIYVSGLDVGTYTLKETKAPDGYNTMKDLVITITAELNPDGSLKSVSKKVEGVDAEPVVYTASSDTAINGIFENGMLPIDPVNNKAPVLPGTGGIGLVIFYVLGGLLLVGAATYIIVSGRKRNKQQQQ